MWRSLLSRLPRQRPLLVQILVPHPQTLVSPLLSPRAQFPLPRFLSADSSASSVRFDTESGIGRENGEKAASFESWSSADRDSDAGSSIFEDSTSHFEKGGAFSEGACENSFLQDNCDDSDASGLAKNEVEVATELDEFDVEKLDEVLSVLQSVEPESVDVKLEEVDFVLSEEFVVRVLQDSNVPLENLIGFFRWAFKRPEFVKSSSVVDLFVEKATRSPEITVGEALMLWDFIREVGEGETELLSAKILNRLIAMFSKLVKRKSVLEIYRKFEETGCAPDGNTYYLTIHALDKPSWAATAWGVCEKMVSSKQFPDSGKVGKIIKFFCKCGKAKDAHMVYLAAKESDKSPPSLYLVILINHLSRKDDTLNMAIDLLEEYAGQLKKPSVEPFACVISGLCRIKDTGKAKELLERMIGSGSPPKNVVFNDVITALSKAGELEDAFSLLKTMKSRRLKPDIRAYNVVMSAFSRAGLMNEALDIFSQAKRVHHKLGRVSYHIISRGYCRIDDFENALKCMNEMKVEGILPNVDDYRKMIQSLCLKALDWKTAEKLLEEMKGSGLRLDGQTRGLIAAVKELEEEEMQAFGEIAEV